MPIEIRPLQTIPEYRLCEDLQRRVWAMPGDLEVVPLHLLLTVQRSGGLLLGAFDQDVLAGFVFGFPGFTEQGQTRHCSHMMGVDPAYQGMGVGYRLKLAQRDFALQQGLELVTWTYDPLESRNAYLNIHKLGALCRTYVRDFYGPLDDGLNAGLPTDRLQAEWWVASERVRLRLAEEAGRLAGLPAAQVNSLRPESTENMAPGMLNRDADELLVQVEIPADYQSVRAADPRLAMKWRLETRQAFERHFDAGSMVVDFVSQPGELGRRCYYLLGRVPASVKKGIRSVTLDSLE